MRRNRIELRRGVSACQLWTLLGVVVPALGAGCNSVAGTTPDDSASRVVWQVNTRGWGVPAVDGRAAYFLTPDHQMIAVDKTGGQELARYTLYTGGGDYPGLVAIRAGPVVAAIDNGVLFAFAPVGAPGRGWTFRPPTGGLEDWITADATTIYAGSSDGRLYAVDAESGTPRWVTVVSAESEAQARAPRVRDGVVYVGIKRVVAPSEGGVAAVDAATGAVRWVRAFSSGRGAACSGDVAFLADGTVIAAAADGQIYALDPATGAPRWVAPSLTGIPAIWGGDPSLDRRPLLARGDLVVAGSTTGYLVGLDASSGRERWRSRADQGSAVSPLVADDALTYAMHFGGQLVAFDLLSGAVRWIDGREPGGGAYADAPILDGGTLYVSGHHGLYALRAGQ